MKVTLTNAFSINMLQGSTDLSFRPVNLREAADFLLENVLTLNAIGHEDTDRIARNHLDSEGVHGIPTGQRSNVNFSDTDALLVAQYRGSRLEVGATVLPEGAVLEWWTVF